MDLEEDYRPGWIGTWCNLTNCAVGSGLLSIPFAFAKMGLVLSFFVYLVVIFCSWLGLYVLARTTLLVENHETKEESMSYRDLVKYIFGWKQAIAFDILVILYCFSVLTGYLVLIKGLIPPIFYWIRVVVGKEVATAAEWTNGIFLLVTFLLVLPLAFAERRKYMIYIASGSILCVVYFAFLILFESSINPWEGVEPCWKHEHDVHLFNSANNLIVGIPIVCLSFGGHLQSVSLFSELKRNQRKTVELQPGLCTLHSWGIVCALSIAFLTLVYFFVGGISYICMIIPGEEAYGVDILQHMINADPYDGFIQSASISVIVILLCSYPTFSFPIRLIMDNLLLFLLPTADMAITQRNRVKIETFIIVVASFLVASIIGDISLVFGVIASTGSVLLQFIIPSMLYLTASITPEYGEKSTILSAFAWIILVFGTLAGAAAAIHIIVYSEEG